MSRPLVEITRVAISAMVKKHLSPSKYGYFLVDEDIEALVRELTEFFETSRSLKSKGDRVMRSARTNPSE